ncbi:MAG TPA: hypothetical protein VFR75_07440 [Solirubrobacterales bacterium]|nr:hypothetical protein [Solirubrobacterales bacterium]
MRTIKLLVLLGATATMLAFASSASATTLTGPNGEVTPTLHFQSEGHVKTASFAAVECTSTFEYTVTSHGPGFPVGGSVNNLTFSPCTNSWHATVVTPGTMTIHYKAAGEGTVTSNGMTVTKTRLGVVCNYATNNTVIGTITDKTVAANKLGTIDISAEVPIEPTSSGLCGTGNTKWTGFYASTTAITLHEK